MSQLEKDLGDSLRRQVDAVPTGAPITLDDVRGRARQITRRRRVAAVAAVAAAVAIVTPGALLLSEGLDRSQAPDPVRPAPTQVEVPEHAKAGSDVLDFRGLPQGAAPGVGYLDRTGSGASIVTPGGNEVRLDTEFTAHAYTGLDDGRFVVLTKDGGESWVEVVDSAGTMTSLMPMVGGLAVDEAHRQVAWANSDGDVVVLRSGEDEARQLGTVPGAMTVRVVNLRGTDCFADAPGGGSYGCVVQLDVTRDDGSQVAMSMTKDDVTMLTNATMDVRGLADTFDDGRYQELDWTSYYAGVREFRPDLTACSGVFGNDAEAAESRWLIETCDHTFDSFSPDGGSLLAWESYGDGAGHYVMGVYDMAGRELLWERTRKDQDMGLVHSAEWEDAEHLVAPVRQGGNWLLVRFGRDGATEKVVGPVAGGESDPAYVVEIQH